MRSKKRKMDHSRPIALAFMQRAGMSGAPASDASLAIYALEHRATPCTSDADFAWLPGLTWKNSMRPL